eukprot:1156653-Pelagomonas_calceolata.AAC.3
MLAKSGRVHAGKVTCPERQGLTTQTKRKSKHRSVTEVYTSKLAPHHGAYDTSARQALSVNPQPESGSVAKDVMGKIQPFSVAYSGIRTRSCELIPVVKVSGSQVHHKLTEVHRVASHNLTSHQIRVCQTIQRRQEV